MPDHYPSPKTRLTLIRDVSELVPAKWQEFVELYDWFLRECIRSQNKKYYLGLSEDDCEDIKQEVLIKLFRNLKKFNTEMPFHKWLWAVVKNVILDLVRKQRGRAKRPGQYGETNPVPDRPRQIAWTPEVEESLASMANQPDETIMRAHDERLLSLAMEKVKTEVSFTYWACFEMHYMNKEPSKTVAERLGISPGSVDTYTCRVLVRIRKQCEYYDIEL
jgi:RNA polymerase sigma factor (sigma-70 family)